MHARQSLVCSQRASCLNLQVERLAAIKRIRDFLALERNILTLTISSAVGSLYMSARAYLGGVSPEGPKAVEAPSEL